MFDRESIEVWNVQMEEYATRIYQKRTEFLEEFIPVFQKHYSAIGDEKEEVNLDYRSQLAGHTMSELLEMYERKDAQTRYSNAGVHRDDLIFTIIGHPVKKFGSQGQQKSYLIALRLAQYEWLKRHLEITPVLLLDDVFDKLDYTRVERLVQLVNDHFFGQVLVTDTDIDRINRIFSETDLSSKIFTVAEGSISEFKPAEVNE